MSPFRIVGIILVILTGVVGSYLIVKNANTQNAIVSRSDNAPPTKELNKNPIQWLKDSGGNSAAAAGDPHDSSIALTGDSSNLTRFFAKTLFGRMQKLDESGKEPFQNFDIKDPQNKKLLDDSIAEIQNSPTTFLKEINEDIDERQIKIITDNSPEAKSKYLEATAKIILANANASYRNQPEAVQKLIQFGDAQGAREVTDAYSKIFDGFLNTEVPSSWFTLHLRYLKLLKNFSAVYAGLLNFQTDPVKATLLIQLLPDLSEVEAGLNQEYYGKTKNLNS